MKKLLLPLLILALALSACGAANMTAQSGAANQGQNQGVLSPIMQVVLGTFKLEGTSQAVTAKQAADLVPLWEVYSSLTQSDTAAQAEIDSLIQQIQDTMTRDQMQTIQKMNLTRQDMFTLLQEKGISFGGPRASGTQTANGSSGFVPGGPGGPRDVPPGGFQGGGGFPGGGGFNDGGAGGRNSSGSGPQASGTPQARFRIDRVPTALLDVLINLLKQRAAS